MRMRHLSFVAAAAAAALLIVGSAAGQAPSKAAIVAGDNFFKTVDGGDPNVTIAAGGHVDFAYASGTSLHNVVFTGSKPTVCGISEGPAGDASALPAQPSKASWAGGCDFMTPGTYPFVCGLHGNMTGKVNVLAAGSTPPAPPPPPPPPPPALAAPAASALRVTTLQRGVAARGSLQVRSTGSRLLVRAFARRNALYGGRSTLRVQVGRLLRPSVGGARVSFSVPLSALARRALRRRGRLSISLRLTVTPPDEGTSYTATRTVILRAL